MSLARTDRTSPSEHPEPARPLRPLAWAAIALGAVILALNLAAIARDPRAWVDMRILFPIIDAWWTGEGELYTLVLEHAGEPGVPSYRYPPVWALSVVPLVGAFELRTAIAVWAALSMVALIAGLAALARETGIGVATPAGAIAFLAVVLFGPLYESFYGPTKDLLIVGLVALTWVLAERRRPWIAGACLAAAAALKIYPALLLVPWVVERRWRVPAAAAVAFVALNVVPLPVLGLADTVTFYVDVLPVAGGTTPSPENAGVDLVLLALSWLAWFRDGVGPLDRAALPAGLATAARAGIALCWVGAAVWAARRGRLERPDDRFLAFGAWVAAVLLMIPASWVNYQILLVFPMLALLARGVGRGFGRIDGIASAAFALAIVVMLVPVKSFLLGRYVDPALSRSDRLSTTVGVELDDELRMRVAEREARLAGLDPGVAELPAGARRDALRRHGVPGPGAGGPRREALDRRFRETGDPGVRARVAAPLRAARTSTAGVVALLALRALAGILAWLAVTVAWLAAPPPAAGREGP